MYKSLIFSSRNLETITEFIQHKKVLLNITNTNFADYKAITNDKTKSISISQIRELIKWANLKPFEASGKLGIIYNAENLTIEAQNSLLKLLEEPNKFTQIILCTSNHRRLLSTIISRCEIIHHTNPEGIQISDKFSDFMTLPLVEKFCEIDKINTMTDKTAQRTSVIELLTSLINYYRKILLHKENQKAYDNLILLSETAKKIHYNVPIKLALENLIINLQS
ncbi:MAG: hypothetical protein WCJ58_01875 [bacterium]